ncbi:MAG: PorV/PorQ family protein [candidate division WOR-3 bacterium]
MKGIVFFILINLFEPGSNSFVFLKNIRNAKDIALGETCATSSDALSFHSNPAILSEVSKFNFSFYSSILWAGIKDNSLVLAGRTPYFNFGISLIYLSYGSFEGRDSFGYKTFNFSAYDFEFSLGISRSFTERLSFGFVLGYPYEKIDKNSSGSIIFSLGTKYIFKDNPYIKIGFSLQNLGQGVKFINESFSLPIVSRVGFSYGKKSFNIVSDFVFSSDNTPYLTFGFSYLIKNILDLRFGLKTDFDYGLLEAFRYGFGINYPNFGIDYALSPSASIFTHHISLKINFK